MRVEVGRATTVTAVFTDTAGAPADQPGGVTVTVTDGAGVQVDSGTATRTDVGTYTWTLTPAVTARLDRLDVKLAADGDTITVGARVVGRRLTTVQAVRDLIAHREVSLVGGPITDDDVLEVAIETAEDWIDEALHYPAVPQGWRARWIEEYGGQILHVPGVQVPGELYEVTVDGTDQPLEDVYAAGSGWSHWDTPGPWPPGRYRGWGTHGLLDPPGQLSRACAVLAAYLARATNVPERASVIRTEGSEIFLSRPSADRPTGLADVDGVVAALSRPSPLGGW